MTRAYQQKRRAEQQQETRQRIVEAAVELHGEQGPGQTTMSAVAERAGVQRNTLYRHFPDERSLLYACSAFHVGRHPMPDPSAWLEIEDGAERCRRGLGELYAHWDDDEQMTAHVLRDAEVSPLVDEVSRLRFGGPMTAIRDALVSGWPGDRRTPETEAAVDLAVGFHTWRSLVRGSGLSSAEAAGLMADAIACTAARV